MTKQIRSKKLGKTLTFSRPGNRYIYVDLNGQPGTLGKRICYGGGLLGETLSYAGNDQKEFDHICLTWYRKYLIDVSSYSKCFE